MARDPTAMRIDHVIYATADLDAAAVRVEAVLGVPAAGGGRHERIGTHNRIVPFDDGYLELLAVADPEEAAGSTLGAAIQAHLAREGEGLFGWAVRVDDVEPVAARLGTAVTTIARHGFSARLTGVAEAMDDPLLPFFIARDPGVPGPVARPGVPAIAWLELGGEAARLERWLGGTDLPVRVVEDGAERGVRAIGVGERELRG
jgi:catechol 2,3-dioxygenase-like lactoylglutathione lyase family enzyme